jgi:hypothetical protein
MIHVAFGAMKYCLLRALNANNNLLSMQNVNNGAVSVQKGVPLDGVKHRSVCNICDI